MLTRQFVTLLIVVTKPQLSPESSIWASIGIKSGGGISNVVSHTSLRLSVVAASRHVEVAANDVQIVQLTSFLLSSLSSQQKAPELSLAPALLAQILIHLLWPRRRSPNKGSARCL